MVKNLHLLVLVLFLLSGCGEGIIQEEKLIDEEKLVRTFAQEMERVVPELLDKIEASAEQLETKLLEDLTILETKVMDDLEKKVLPSAINSSKEAAHELVAALQEDFRVNTLPCIKEELVEASNAILDKATENLQEDIIPQLRDDILTILTVTVTEQTDKAAKIAERVDKKHDEFVARLPMYGLYILFAIFFAVIVDDVVVALAKHIWRKKK